ncbi:MAG: flagellar export chaperone FliS [Planctomycetota bacterium]
MNATLEYQRNAILSASREKLVLLMYDGALRFARQSMVQLDKGNHAEYGRLISRTFNIVSELKVSLDREAGAQIASRLDQLYRFVMDALVKANANRSKKDLEDALKIMTTLREGWAGIIASA